MYGIYYYLNVISYNRAPAVVFDDKYIASIFNDFYNTERDMILTKLKKLWIWLVRKLAYQNRVCI